VLSCASVPACQTSSPQSCSACVQHVQLVSSCPASADSLSHGVRGAKTLLLLRLCTGGAVCPAVQGWLMLFMWLAATQGRPPCCQLQAAAGGNGAHHLCHAPTARPSATSRTPSTRQWCSGGVRHMMLLYKFLPTGELRSSCAAVHASPAWELSSSHSHIVSGLCVQP